MNKKMFIATAFIFVVIVVLVGMGGYFMGAKSKSVSAQPESASVNEVSKANQTAQTSETQELGSNKEKQFDVSFYTNKWGDVPKSMVISAKIKNNSGFSASDWKLCIDVPENTKIDNSWNGNYSIENNKIVVLPVDYNKTISDAVEIGFQITAPNDFDPSAYTFEAVVNSERIKETQSTAQAAPIAEQTSVSYEGYRGVNEYGQLKVIDGRLCDKNSNPVVLRGMSSHGIAWYPQFTENYTIQKTKQYGANLFRVAVYTEEYGGYTTGSGNDEKMKNTAFAAVDNAIKNDMYAILDWHILSDGNPQKHKAEAAVFFDEASKKYADNPAVLYEICNEPNNVSWENDIKPYAEEIIKVIRANSPNAVIIVGSNTWSQDIDDAAASPLGYDNIMYSLHFYAGTHKLDDFKPKLEKAFQAKLAVFVTEWGSTAADGNNGVYLDEAKKWLDYLSSNSISWANWSMSDKDESSAALKTGSDPYGWDYDSLSESGKFAFDSFK